MAASGNAAVSWLLDEMAVESMALVLVLVVAGVLVPTLFAVVVVSVVAAAAAEAVVAAVVAAVVENCGSTGVATGLEWSHTGADKLAAAPDDCCTDDGCKGDRVVAAASFVAFTCVDASGSSTTASFGVAAAVTAAAASVAVDDDGGGGGLAAALNGVVVTDTSAVGPIGRRTLRCAVGLLVATVVPAAAAALLPVARLDLEDTARTAAAAATAVLGRR
jgi:hypothetical protein